MKSTLIGLIWGQRLDSFSPQFFKKISQEESKLCDITLVKGVTITSFQKSVDKGFDLVEKYDVKLSDKSSMKVVLQEEEVITAIYTNTQFYQSIAQEFCIVFDVLLAKTGTEAPAETHYRIVSNQEMDGGQDLSTLSMRARIDSCFPATIQCQRPVEEIAALYRKGDKGLGLKRHRIPIYKDTRSVRRDSKGMSLVISRHANAAAPLPFAHSYFELDLNRIHADVTRL